MTAMSEVTDRGTTGAPVRRLILLYDAQCPLCTFLRNWLARQRQLVPLDLVPAGSEEARRRCPGIDHISTLSEITLVGDSGQIYRGPAAWVVTLWALSEYRPLSHKFSTPRAPASRAPRSSPPPSTARPTGTSRSGRPGAAPTAGRTAGCTTASTAGRTTAPRPATAAVTCPIRL